MEPNLAILLNFQVYQFNLSHGQKFKYRLGLGLLHMHFSTIYDFGHCGFYSDVIYVSFISPQTEKSEEKLNDLEVSNIYIYIYLES